MSSSISPNDRAKIGNIFETTKEKAKKSALSALSARETDFYLQRNGMLLLEKRHVAVRETAFLSSGTQKFRS